MFGEVDYSFMDGDRVLFEKTVFHGQLFDISATHAFINGSLPSRADRYELLDGATSVACHVRMNDAGGAPVRLLGQLDWFAGEDGEDGDFGITFQPLTKQDESQMSALLIGVLAAQTAGV